MAISGATAPAYVPVVGDIGNTLTISVTATNSAGSSAAAISAATSSIIAGIPTINTAASIPGTPQVGTPVTAIDAIWNNTVTSRAYQWKSAGVNATGAGATTLTYTPVTGDIGHTLTITVTAANSAGTSAPSTSAASAAVVSAQIPVNTVVPVITGTAQVGQTLTATTGTWTNMPTSYVYQWSRAGILIVGATASTYVPQPADIGNRLTVSVIATNSAGSSAAATSAATGAVVASGPTAARTQSLTNTLGVAAHTGNYVQGPMVTDAQYLGVHLWRDGMAADKTKLQALYSVGIDFIGFADSVVPATNITNAKAIAAFGPGALFDIEGLNEPTNFPSTYNGHSSGSTWQGVAEFQRDYYTAIQADANLTGIKVSTPSNVGQELGNWGVQYLTVPAGPPPGVLTAAGTVLADRLTLHVYPTLFGGHQSASYVDPTKGDVFVKELSSDFVTTWLQGFPGYTLPAATALPRLITETGMSSLGGSPGGSNVDRPTQGKNILTGFLNSWMEGYLAFCIYIIYDEGDGYGLFDSPGTPKPSATYLHNFTTVMKDAGATAGTFTTGALNFSLVGMPSTAKSQLFQKSNGNFELVLWNNVTNWNWGAGTPIAIAATNVTVTFGAAQPVINTYDPTVGSTPISTVTNTASVVVALKDYPMIVEVIPAPAATLTLGLNLTANSLPLAS